MEKTKVRITSPYDSGYGTFTRYPNVSAMNKSSSLSKIKLT